MKQPITAKRLISYALVGLTLAACKARDASLVPPAKTTVEADQIVSTVQQNTTGQAQVVSAPKVDIMFYMDDSESMNLYIDLMQKNVHRLVESLGLAKALDVRVAVTQIWDRTRYTTGIVPPVCTKPDGTLHQNYLADGAALDLKIPAGKETDSQYAAYKGRNWISTKEPGAMDVIESSIMIPVQDLLTVKNGKAFKQPNGTLCESGPAVENIFEAIEGSLTSSYNKSFWRPDALKVFMVLSDAKDGSGLKAVAVDQHIRRLLHFDPKKMNGQQDQYRVYVAGSVPGTRVDKDARTGHTKVDMDHCRPDFGFQDPVTKAWPPVVPPHAIYDLAKLSQGEMFSICNPQYGDQLAKFGDEIKRTSLKNKRITLSGPVNINPQLVKVHKEFSVTVDGQPLTEGIYDHSRQTGEELIVGNGADWAYDLEKNEVVIRGNFWNDHPNADVVVNYAPVK